MTEYTKYLMNNFVIFILLLSCFSFYSKAENFNDCIKSSVKKNIPVNKILTLCREKIESSLPIGKTKIIPNKESNFISTSKTEEIIHNLIETGELDKASDLAERLEIEKTKRIKAKAEAEALRAPQVITNTTSSAVSENNSASSNIRSVILLGSNPINTTNSGSSIVTISAQGNHGAIAGQYVTLSNINSAIDGIPASDLNKRHVISSITNTTQFTISVSTSASLGSISGGGSLVTATFEN